MIDNIKLWFDNYCAIKHLNKNFFEERDGVFTKFNNDYTFKLYNPNNKANKTFLRVQINESCTYLKITGSLRKFYYGEESLKDFSKMDFIKAIEILSVIFEIPIELFNQFSISMTEIGLNTKVTEKCSNILSMVIGYKSSLYEPATFRGYKRYKTACFEIKLYDKYAEIIGAKSKRKYIKTPSETNFINDNLNKNWLRVELKITKGKNIKSRLGYKAVGEMTENFNDLYLYFWNNIQELQFNDIYNQIPVFDSNNKSDKEMNDYLRSVGIYTLGVDVVNQMVSKLKNRTLRSRLIKKYESLNFGTYNKLSFLNNTMGQIALNLIKSGRTPLAKELVPILRANSTYNTIRRNATKSKQ